MNNIDKWNSIRQVLFRTFLITFIIIALTYTEKSLPRWSSYPDIYNVIHNQTGSVDLVTVGSSRVVNAINAPIIQEAIFNSTGDNWVVYDLAITGRGMGLNYLILKELLEKRNVKRILVEYNKSPPVIHGNFYLVAGFDDFVTNFKNDIKYNLIERLSNLVSSLLDRISKNWEKVLLNKGIKNQIISTSKIVATTSDTNASYHTNPKEFNKRLLKNKKKYINNFFSEPHKWEFETPKEIRTSNYVKDIIELAKKYDSEVIFVHFISQEESFLEPEFIAEFETYFKSKLIQPDQKTIRSWFNKNGSFKDEIHMSVNGSKLFAKWLAEEYANNGG